MISVRRNDIRLIDMEKTPGIKVVSFIEIFIGSFTLFALILSKIMGLSSKPFAVSVFVFITSFVSLSLGIGLLFHRPLSYHLLIFFAVIIIISKVLVFSNILQLSGSLETEIPSWVKNAVSLIYHVLLIIYFSKSEVKKRFGVPDDVFFAIKSPYKKHSEEAR